MLERYGVGLAAQLRVHLYFGHRIIVVVLPVKVPAQFIKFQSQLLLGLWIYVSRAVDSC
jgi:hypothetical protein